MTGVTGEKLNKVILPPCAKNKQGLIKQQIFWDVDDVVLNTCEATVDLLNQEYRIPNGLTPKTVEDCKDWGFNSIYKPLSEEEREHLFETEEFWRRVKIKDGFTRIVQSGILSEYQNFFLTKGNIKNLQQKLEFLKDVLDSDYDLYNFTFIGLQHVPKSFFNMAGGMMIDDNIHNLTSSNAQSKILLKNNLETTYNNSFDPIETTEIHNIYVVNTLDEVYDILKFQVDNGVAL